METGNRYTYFTAGAGAAFFHNGEERQWYIGGSIGHINQPLTHPGLPESRLLISQGMQAGYTIVLTAQSTVGGYAVFTWQYGGYEHIIGARYSRSLGGSANTTFFGGMGYRIHDALIPHIGFSTGSHRLSFHYEINPFASAARNYHRQSFDLSYRYLF